MQYTTLGNTGCKVSKICLGTMTYGEQNTEAQAHEQMDYALAQGVNFFDTAELYPVPPGGETQGLTEAYIGSWFKVRNNRDKVVLATKAAGPGEFVSHIRGGPNFTKAHIEQALEASLTRLNTDYVDLYQLHWPNRMTNFFGELGYAHKDESFEPVVETILETLSGFVKSGKVRFIGLSNETAWGVMKYLQAAGSELPRVVSIQNPYNLLNRSFEVGLAEIAHREKVGLLAYSPMAFGVLSGKYLNDQWPEGARITLFKRFSRYLNDNGKLATQKYVDLAKAHNLDPAQMALAYVNSRSFVTSNIIGATTMSQLKTNIESIDLTLSEDVLSVIEEIHTEISNPCP